MEQLVVRDRETAQNFALKAYRLIKGNRAYAVNDESKNVLAILGAALLQKRKAEGRDDMDGTPVAQKQMVDLLTKLNDAGLKSLSAPSARAEAVAQAVARPCHR
jgi:hypothetical protein